MLFEQTDTDESGNSLSDVSSSDNDFSRMQFESSNSKEHVNDDDADLQLRDEIESESDAEFQDDHRIVEEVMLS